MKFLFTVQNYLPQVSGVPIIVSGIAEELVRRGHIVHVATRRFQGEKEEELINGVKVHRFSIFHRKFLGILGEVDKYKKFVKEHDAENLVLECSQCETTDLLLDEIKTYKNKQVIFHSHGFSGLLLKPFVKTTNPKIFFGNLYRFFRFSNYYKGRFKRALPYFDKAIALSRTESSYDYLVKNFHKNVDVIPNFCSEMFVENKTSIDLSDYGIKREYMINIANFEEVKDQKRLLLEFYLSEAGKKIDLVLIGSSKNRYYTELLKLKNQYDIKFGTRRIIFLTGVEREKLPYLLRRATCFLLTSKIEAFSVSIIESLMCGTPFLSTEVGSVRSLPGGIVVNPSDCYHYSIDRVWELKLSGGLNKLGLEGLEFAKNNLKLKTVVDKFESVINQN